MKGNVSRQSRTLSVSELAHAKPIHRRFDGDQPIQLNSPLKTFRFIEAPSFYWSNLLTGSHNLEYPADKSLICVPAGVPIVAIRVGGIVSG